MNKTFVRVVFALLAVAYVLSHFFTHAHAQSSLGIGTNEATLPSSGFFGSLLNWVNVHQQQFYRALTGALKEMRSDGSKLWLLVGLSFAYGIFHAAGPGHGKAVISSYMLANEVALRRGIMLSFVSAFLQALTAIVVMTAVFLLLRGTAISMTDATWFLEVASYALISCFGAWLLWTKLRPFFGSRAAHSLSAAHAAATHHDHHHDHDHGQGAYAHDHAHHDHAHHHDHVHGHAHEGVHTPHPAQAASFGATLVQAFRPHDHSHDHEHGHAHAGDEVCETCGHSHAPDPKLISGEHFNWRTAWSAVAAVGLRPCSGALIVLSFAFLNGLWAGGILSVIAMAVGTGITVSILATIAVTAKNWAVYFAGDGRMGNHVHKAIEIIGAAFVLVLGLVLLGASLSA